MTFTQENKLKARILELEGLYRNSSAHRDEMARQNDELVRLLESARSVAASLEAECALCPDVIHNNPGGA
jgi:hypothetical protein